MLTEFEDPRGLMRSWTKSSSESQDNGVIVAILPTLPESRAKTLATEIGSLAERGIEENIPLDGTLIDVN